jgi:hypothetical protein
MFNSLAGWSLILNVAVLLVTAGGFIKVLRNDLWHLDKYVKEIKGDVKTLGEKVDTIGERVSKIEGKLEG